MTKQKQITLEIQAGDIVTLKSGGPTMTVMHVDFERLSCTWFDQNENVRVAEFVRAVLVLAGSEKET